jgi:amino acid transporter
MQSKKYHRVIGPWTMMFGAVSAIIGSGWLFSGYYSSQIAGPAAILSWIIAAVLVIVVAFTFAEIATLLPVPGGSSHFPHITHGALVSVVLSWISWLSVAVLPTIEVQAVLQYASFFFPWLLSHPDSINTSLSLTGYMIAAMLLLVFSVVNIYSIRLVMRFNNAIAIWKIIIPILAAVTLIMLSFHKQNFTANGGFMPVGWHGVFSAIAAGGIVFAFNGFKNVVELAGEAAKPTRTVPFALIGGLTVCLIIYLLLQTAFIGAIPSASLTQGWVNLHFAGVASPLVSLLAAAGSMIMLGVLYIDTMVAPLGAGLTYVTSGSRILQAMSQNRQMPHMMALVNQRGIPAVAILINLFLSLLFFFPFPGWKLMVDFISSLMAFSYALGPICLIVLRYQLPHAKRAIKLPFGLAWGYIAFYICTLMCYWTGWQVISKLAIFLILALSCYTLYRLCSPWARTIKLDWQASIWIWVYFAGLTCLSYVGNFGGGKGLISFGPDFIVVAALSAITLFLAVRYRVNDADVLVKCEHLMAGIGMHPELETAEIREDSLKPTPAM